MDAMQEAENAVEDARERYEATPNRTTLAALTEAKTRLYQLRMAPAPRRERTTYAVDCWTDDDDEMDR